MRSCKTLSVGSSGPLYPMRFNQAFWSNTAPVIGKTPYPCMSEIYPTTRRRTTLGAAQRADDVRSWAERTSQLRASRSGKGPVSDLGIAGHRPAIVLYEHSISPSLGATLSSEHVERRLAAILAADVAGSCRLIGIDEEGTLAQLKAFRKTLFDPKITDHRGRIVKNPGTALSLSSPAWSTPCDVPSKFSAAWPNKISMYRRPSGSNFASASTSVILSSTKMTSMVMGSILRCVSKGSQRRAVSAFPTMHIGKFVAR